MPPSTRTKITPWPPVAVTNYNAGKKYYFYRGNVQRFPEFQLPATVIIVFRSVSGLAVRRYSPIFPSPYGRRVKKIRAQTFPIININISKVCRSPRIFYRVCILPPPKFSYLTVAKCGGNFEACFSFFFFPPKILFSFFCLPWKNLREIVFRACVGSRYICACKKFHTIPPLFRKQGATAPATPLPRIPVFITYHKLQLFPLPPRRIKKERIALFIRSLEI